MRLYFGKDNNWNIFSLWCGLVFRLKNNNLFVQKLFIVVLTICLTILFSTTAFAYSAFDDNYLVEADGFYDSATIADGENINVRLVITSQPIGVFSDSNVKVKVGTYFDDNAPSVLITYPSDGTVFSSTNIPIIYYSENESLVTKYYVKLDASEWVDNGLNKGYLFSNLSIGRHVFYVKAVDVFGLIGSEFCVTPQTLNDMFVAPFKGGEHTSYFKG